MAADLRALFRLYRLYAGMDAQWFVQDKVICIVVIASEIVSNIASVAGILLLAVRFGGVGGLTADEVLFMLGFYQLAGGFTYMLFGGFNVQVISRRAARGQFDHMLIQPRPLWMQLMAEGFMPVSGSSGFLIGVLLTAIACARLHIAPSPGWFLALVLYIGCHAAIKLGQNYLYGAAAFYKPVACEEISAKMQEIMDLVGKYPLAGLPAWALTALTTVLPVGLMAYVPALALLGKLERPAHYALPVAVAAAFVTLATYCFKKGLLHYAKNSCNRYRDIGHRR
jgi:ABC-2 type transport system permease protein